MFSLIITIISIALVAALAIAAIYHGGSAFRQGPLDKIFKPKLKQGYPAAKSAARYRYAHLA